MTQRFKYLAVSANSPFAKLIEHASSRSTSSPELQNKIRLLKTEFSNEWYKGDGGLSQIDSAVLKDLDKYANLFDAHSLEFSIKSILNCHTPKNKLKAFNGLMHEIKTQLGFALQYPASLMPAPPTIHVAFSGYDHHLPHYQNHNKLIKPSKHLSAPIQMDIALQKQGYKGKLKPYIYEVKCYNKKTAYQTPGNVNQLLKYQAAIDQNKVAGATVEIKGLVSQKFVDWAKAMVPDLQILINIPLPSGAAYRHSIQSGTNAMPVLDESASYSREDKTIINGIQKTPNPLNVLIQANMKAYTRHFDSTVPACPTALKPDDFTELSEYKSFTAHRRQLFWKQFELQAASTKPESTHQRHHSAP